MKLRRVGDEGALHSASGPATVRIHRVVGWAAVIVATVALGACGDTTVGMTVRPSIWGKATTSAPAPAPSIVPSAGINTKLLNLTQLGAIVGDTDMRPNGSYAEPNTFTSGIDPSTAYPPLRPQCRVGTTRRLGSPWPGIPIGAPAGWLRRR